MSVRRSSTRKAWRIVIANNRVIVDYRLINQDALSPFEPYPLTTGDGRAGR